jgi:ATP-dependent Clp protease ATP-binding subunit ClpB
LAAQHIEVEFAQNVAEGIAESSCDAQYGARPIQRYIQKHLESFLSREIIAGNIAADSKIAIGMDKEGKFCMKYS